MADELGVRLTHALNAAIDSKAVAPFGAMAAHLRAHKDEPPPKLAEPEEGTTLLPEVTQYLSMHSIQTVLNSIAVDLGPNLPDDPVGFVADRLAAVPPPPLLPLLDAPGFWDKEAGAPLLGRNAGFLTREVGVPEAWQARVAEWPALCGATEPAEPASGECDEAALRIFLRDAERTFCDGAHRDAYQAMLKSVWPENRDYNQGLGYTCSLLMLLFDEPTVTRMLLQLTRSERYTPGYWLAAPDAYVRDAKVYGRLLEEREPEVHALLQTACLVPESYASKWFNGLCLHVLPYSALFPFIEQ